MTEEISLECRSFLETMNPILTKIKVAQLTSNEFMLGMDACFQIVINEKFRFAYDHLVKFLIDAAPELTKDRYLDVSNSIIRMASYMHRFEIPKAKLSTLMQISEEQLPRCRP